MSTKKRWRKSPADKPRAEDRFWRRAPGGLLGWSGRVLEPDRQVRERRPGEESTSRVVRAVGVNLRLAPTNRRLAHLELAGYRRHRLPSRVTLGRELVLTRVELGGAAERDAAGAFNTALVRARISERSNSASPPKIVISSLPWAVVVSHQASASDLNDAPAAVT